MVLTIVSSLSVTPYAKGLELVRRQLPAPRVPLFRCANRTETARCQDILVICKEATLESVALPAFDLTELIPRWNAVGDYSQYLVSLQDLWVEMLERSRDKCEELNIFPGVLQQKSLDRTAGFFGAASRLTKLDLSVNFDVRQICCLWDTDVSASLLSITWPSLREVKLGRFRCTRSR